MTSGRQIKDPNQDMTPMWDMPASLDTPISRRQRRIRLSILAAMIGAGISYAKIPWFENLVDQKVISPVVSAVKEHINALDIRDAFINFR